MTYSEKTINFIGAFFFLIASYFYLLTFDFQAGYFVDEIYNFTAAVNFLSYGIYTPGSVPNGLGYEYSVSSGIVSTAPAGLGLLVGGSVFWGRIFFILHHILIAIFC